MEFGPLSVSVIVTTYNWPGALDLVLQSLFRQTRRPDQVLIADDGSDSTTATLIKRWQDRWSAIEHVWQPDDGFRAGEARNRAIQAATSDWLVMIDGDCICPPTFVANHLRLAAANRLVPGNRLLLSPEQTQRAIQSSDVRAIINETQNHRKLRTLPLGPLRDMTPKAWTAVRTCNVGVSRAMALQVSGFDETFKGWGKEDSDFAARCIHAGARVRLGKFACTVLHLHHEEETRHQLSRNQAKLDRVLREKRIQPEQSLLRDDQ